MTVGELIKKLESFDKDKEVIMRPPANYIYTIDGVMLSNDLPSRYNKEDLDKVVIY